MSSRVAFFDAKLSSFSWQFVTRMKTMSQPVTFSKAQSHSSKRTSTHKTNASTQRCMPSSSWASRPISDWSPIMQVQSTANSPISPTNYVNKRRLRPCTLRSTMLTRNCDRSITRRVKWSRPFWRTSSKFSSTRTIARCSWGRWNFWLVSSNYCFVNQCSKFVRSVARTLSRVTRVRSHRNSSIWQSSRTETICMRDFAFASHGSRKFLKVLQPLTILAQIRRSLVSWPLVGAKMPLTCVANFSRRSKKWNVASTEARLQWERCLSNRLPSKLLWMPLPTCFQPPQSWPEAKLKLLIAR